MAGNRIEQPGFVPNQDHGNGIIGISMMDRARAIWSFKDGLNGKRKESSHDRRAGRLAGLTLSAALLTSACTDFHPFGIGAPSASPTTEAAPDGSAATAAPTAAATSPAKTAEPTGTPKPTEAPKPTGAPTPTKSPDATASTVTQTGVSRLQHPDEGGRTIEIRLPNGFTPDAALHVSTDTKALAIGDLNQYRDWETALNTGRPVGDRLAGYNYDYNDFCPVRDFKCNVQLDMYAWRIFQGQEVDVPGIGHLVGSERRSVVLIVLNLADDVKAYDEREAGQVTVVRGFTATGRIFDGNKVAVTERNVTGHWLFRQKEGTPEKSYIGVTDSPENARETLLVTVIRKQWGNNPDGTKRYQDQLLRAEIVTLK